MAGSDRHPDIAAARGVSSSTALARYQAGQRVRLRILAVAKTDFCFGEIYEKRFYLTNTSLFYPLFNGGETTEHEERLYPFVQEANEKPVGARMLFHQREGVVPPLRSD